MNIKQFIKEIFEGEGDTFIAIAIMSIPIGLSAYFISRSVV